MGDFSNFLNCKNGTKLRKASHVIIIWIKWKSLFIL